MNFSGLNKGFAKVPKVYAYTENADIIGASFYIMEKIDGIILSAKEAYKRQIAPNDFKIIAFIYIRFDIHTWRA